MKVAAVCGLIMHIFLALAVILALVNLPRKSGGAVARMAGLSGTFAIVGVCLLLFLVEFVDFHRLRGDLDSLVNRPKALLLYGGYLVVAIAGVVDVIIGTVRGYHVGRAGQ